MPVVSPDLGSDVPIFMVQEGQKLKKLTFSLVVSINYYLTCSSNFYEFLYI